MPWRSRRDRDLPLYKAMASKRCETCLRLINIRLLQVKEVELAEALREGKGKM